jgi:hypothetical protein
MTLHEADLLEIISVPADSRKQPDISREQADTVDELIDRARFMSRNTYAREVMAVINGIQVARFAGRYFLDNPDGLPKP